MQDSGIQVLLQGNNLLRILQGLGVTIGISVISVLLSMVLGTLLGIIMTSRSKIHPNYAPTCLTLYCLLWVSTKL